MAGTEWVCVRCGEALTELVDNEGMVGCVNGHIAYSGYVAEAQALRPRLRWLDERIFEGDPAPDAETARAGGIWAPQPSGPDATAGLTEAPESSAGPGVQVLLLGLGAALLIIAGIVFTAVNWDRLGAAGQVAVMAIATLSFGLAAVRLAHRLPGTAEALAVVAFGLAVVDVVAAPALGLVPDEWLDVEHPYFAVVTCIGAAAFVVLGRRTSLRAWVWLGWSAVAVGAALISWFLALGPADGENPWAASSVTVVAVATVLLWSAPHVAARLRTDLQPLIMASAVALPLAGTAWLALSEDLDTAAIVGTAITTGITGASAALVWRRIPDTWAGRVAGLCAAGLLGVALGLILLLPADNDAQAASSQLADSPWLALAVGLAGSAVLAVLVRVGHSRSGLLASFALWTTWGCARLVIAPPQEGTDDVLVQMAVLLAVVALTWYAVSVLRVEPGAAWPAAAAAELSWLALLPGLSWPPDIQPEVWSVPLGAVLILSGYLWHRCVSGDSLLWLSPGVSLLLLPSALACWDATWVSAFTDDSETESIVRLIVVLLAGAVALVLGVRLRLRGLVLPSAIALAIAGSAQVWSGLSTLPRWLALAIVGAILFVLGARVEWVRRTGRGARAFLQALH